MNKEALFYNAYNAYLNGMIKQAWGGRFAARRAQNAYARGNQAMGNRLMQRAYNRGYPMGGYGQQQQYMQQPQQQPRQPMQQQPQQPMQQPRQPMPQQPPQPAPQGLPPARPQQPMQQQPQQNQWKPAPYQHEATLTKSTPYTDMYGRPLEIADLD